MRCAGPIGETRRGRVLAVLYGPSTDLVKFLLHAQPHTQELRAAYRFRLGPFHNGKTAVRGGLGSLMSCRFPTSPHSICNDGSLLGTYGTVGPPGLPPPQGILPYGIPALLSTVNPQMASGHTSTPTSSAITSPNTISTSSGNSPPPTTLLSPMRVRTGSTIHFSLKGAIPFCR